MAFKWIKDGLGSVSAVLFGTVHQFDKEHVNYDKLVKAVENGDAENFLALVDTGGHIRDWSEGEFEFSGGYLRYKEHQIPEVIQERILQMIKEGANHQPILRFLERLYTNTSYRAIRELYGFLRHGNLPITPDGHFLAYKYVSVYDKEDSVDKNGRKLTKGDYVDTHTQKSYRNNIGDEPTMPRYMVDDNYESHCSDGLHVGTVRYSGGHTHVVIAQVDPADVVSVPNDGAEKVRCCRYKVVTEFKGTFISQVVPFDPYVPVTSPAIESDYDDEDEDDEDWGDNYDCPACEDFGCGQCDLDYYDGM